MKVRDAFCGEVIYNKDIDNYCDEYFWSCLYAYNMTKMWGLAHGAGWATEPISYIDAITAIESEFNAFENKEREKQMEESKKKTQTKKPRGR